jgi:drug/metabolite transporter (DMT)-like permease
MLRPQHQTASLLEFSLVLLLGILWGLPYALTKLSLASIPPLTLVAARVLLAATVLWIAALALGRRVPWSWNFAGSIAVQGCVACVIPYTLIAFGQRSVDSSLAAILNSTTPLFVCLIGVIWTRHESITAGRMFGSAVGLGGVVMIAGTSALAGLGQETIGQAAILLATVSSAVSAIYGRRFAGVAPEVTAACVLTSAAVLLFPLCLLVEAPWHSQPSLVSLAALAANAVVATALGFVVYFRLIRTIGSMGTASAGYLKPGVGVLIGCTLLGENLTWTTGAGLLAVLIGVVAINGKTSIAPLLDAVGRAGRRFRQGMYRRARAQSAAQN